MCRSIKTLRRPEGRATDDEIAAAALQYVRKVSGFRAPSQRNTEAFDAAVQEIGPDHPNFPRRPAQAEPGEDRRPREG